MITSKKNIRMFVPPEKNAKSDNQPTPIPQFFILLLLHNWNCLIPKSHYIIFKVCHFAKRSCTTTTSCPYVLVVLHTQDMPSTRNRPSTDTSGSDAVDDTQTPNPIETTPICQQSVKIVSLSCWFL